jgi:type IV secretory pathway TrbF-like protein
MRQLKKTDPLPVGDGASGSPRDNAPGRQTYLAARAEWNERYGSYIQQARSWRLVALLSMSVSVIAVAGVVYIGSQSRLGP